MLPGFTTAAASAGWELKGIRLSTKLMIKTMCNFLSMVISLLPERLGRRPWRAVPGSASHFDLRLLAKVFQVHGLSLEDFIMLPYGPGEMTDFHHFPRRV